jgi:pimeloyl-ACP methyl ester carboxylesterase
MRWKQEFIVSLLLGLTSVAWGDGQPAQTQPDFLDGLESRLLYFPRAYDPADVDQFIQNGGSRLDYKTSQGKQTAWLILPAGGVKPQRLWVVCCGNGTLALEAAPFLRQAGLQSDAFLLVDYPGYGFCEGKPSPDSIGDDVKASVLAAAAPTGIDATKKPELVCVFGHSLGCAAALMAVEEFHLKSAVLCSPFTSTHEMAERMIGLAKSAPFHHQFDNRIGLNELVKNKGHAWIFHGSVDEIIPVERSKTLAAEFKDVVTLQVVDNAHHNDVMLIARIQVIAAMAEARK